MYYDKRKMFAACATAYLQHGLVRMRTASELFLPDDPDASQVLEGKRQGIGQSPHKHQVFRDLQFEGEGLNVGWRKFSSTGLIFYLKIRVQFSEDLDIAVDI